MTALRRLLRTPSGATGAALAAVLVLVAVVGPLVYGADPDLPDFAATLRPPDRRHPLGTDAFGRDQLARLMIGARRSLVAGVAIVAFVVTVGMFVGLVAGLVGGVVDALVARLIDITLAIPSLVVALAIVGALGPGFRNLVVALAAANWASFARLARGFALSARSRPDLVAARLAGVGWWRRTVGHVVPATATQLLAVATLEVGSVIVSLAGLSFLGLGAQPPAAEWGAMLADSRGVFTVAPWLLLGPSVAVFLAVASSVLLGDALRDVVDPGASGQNADGKRSR